MADVTLRVYYIHDGLGSGPNYLTGQYIRVIADGSSIRAELWDSQEGGIHISTPSGGPDLNSEIGVYGNAFNDVRYCVGSDQVYYTLQDNWPYAAYHLNLNHPTCSVIVCDLDIIGTPEVTNESTTGASDGQIAIQSTSSNGMVKYSLIPDFDYATQGLPSPLTGLGTGLYTVYAKDAAGCMDQAEVFVGVDYNYGPRWRMEYDNVLARDTDSKYTSRIDIEERDYEGEIEEICGGPEPCVIEYLPDDDSMLVPSKCRVQINVPRLGDGKFDDIRTGYDRQFVIKKYRKLRGADDSTFSLEWAGYITPEFYQEPYLEEPYIIELEAIDGLGELKNKDFKAQSGEEYFGEMTLIKIVSECLQKLPLRMNIRSCVNIYELAMAQTADDDPLAQTLVPSENYRTKKCEDALNDVLRPFTHAELFQSLGVWWIRTREQSVYASLPYRQFGPNGEYQNNGTQTGRRDLNFPAFTNRFMFTDASQLLNYSRNYGKFKITHNLNKDNNMVDSGGFEAKDIDLSTNFFRGWTVAPLQSNVTSGIEFVDNGDSKGAFFFQWAPNTSDQQDNRLITEELPISFAGNPYVTKQTRFKLKFQLYVSPSQPVQWIRVAWKFRFIDKDTGDFYDWRPASSDFTTTPDPNVDVTNDIYVTSFNSWQTYEFYFFRAPGGVDVFNMAIQASFYFHNHQGRDFISEPLFRAHPTTQLVTGKRYYFADGGLRPTIGYELKDSADADDGFNVIEPDDYNVISNRRKWIKISEYNLDAVTPLLDRIMIDNFKISLFTLDPAPIEFGGNAYIDPPETIVFEEQVTELNEAVFEEEVNNGDAPDIVGTEYIYNGFYRLADGTKTRNWARANVDESSYLLQIYLNYLKAQGQRSLRKLSGSVTGDLPLGYINSLEDQRDYRKYRFVRFTQRDKAGIYDIDTEETLTGDGDVPPSTEEFSIDYSNDFNAPDL